MQRRELIVFTPGPERQDEQWARMHMSEFHPFMAFEPVAPTTEDPDGPAQESEQKSPIAPCPLSETVAILPAEDA